MTLVNRESPADADFHPFPLLIFRTNLTEERKHIKDMDRIGDEQILRSLSEGTAEGDPVMVSVEKETTVSTPEGTLVCLSHLSSGASNRALSYRISVSDQRCPLCHVRVPCCLLR